MAPGIGHLSSAFFDTIYAVIRDCINLRSLGWCIDIDSVPVNPQ